MGTFLSAVLVSGGSASGDSIWTEEDGNAFFDGKVVSKGGSMHVLEPSVSGILLRQLGGVNRIDSYDDPITTEHPLHLKADGFKFEGKGGPELMTIASDGRVDIIGSLYVNGSPISLDVMITDLEKDVKLKDKLIEKLEARLDALEKKLKK